MIVPKKPISHTKLTKCNLHIWKFSIQLMTAIYHNIILMIPISKIFNHVAFHLWIWIQDDFIHDLKSIHFIIKFITFIHSWLTHAFLFTLVWFFVWGWIWWNQIFIWFFLWNWTWWNWTGWTQTSWRSKMTHLPFWNCSMHQKNAEWISTSATPKQIFSGFSNKYMTLLITQTHRIYVSKYRIGQRYSFQFRMNYCISNCIQLNNCNTNY